MASQPLSDDVLNDTSGFPDSTPTPTPAPAAEPKPDDKPDEEPLELTEDQVLDDKDALDPDAPPEKTENPVEKRIKGALKARDDARNELANEREAKAALERRLAAIEAKMTPEAGKAPDAAEEAAPDPEDYEYGALDQKYIDDSVAYKTKIAVKEALGQVETQYQEEQRNRQAQQAQEQALTAAKDIVAKGAALYDDFEEVVWERGLREEYKLDKPTFDAILEADHSAEITYALASDPVEAARVAALSPAQQAKYVFQKDAELSASKPARVTKAPPPPGSQVKGSSGRFTVAPDTEDLDAFEKEFFKKR